MASRRGQGEGSLYQRADGLWVGAVSLGWEGGKRRRKKVYGKTQAEARTKMRRVLEATDKGLPVADDRVTVEGFLNRWLADTVPHAVEATTADNYANVVRLYLVPHLGKRKLARLTPADVETATRAIIDSGRSPTTAALARKVLRRALRHAEREGLVVRNVAALADAPKLDQAEGRALTPDQARTFLAAVHGHRLEAAFTLGLSLGLRPGETLGLRWECVDLEAATLRVEHSVKWVRTKPGERRELIVGAVKTKGSRRTLHLPPQLVDLLKTHRARQAAERLKAGPGWSETGLVFTTPAGGPLDGANYRHALDRVCDGAGLGHWHPHELRHSAASLLAAQGVPLKDVSELLGHSSTRITADVYTHLFAPAKREVAETMARVLWKSAGAEG